MIYYVNAKAETPGKGTKDSPFLTIQEAADIAMPGDEVVVYPGIYREAVNPIHGGTPDARITYRSVEKGAAVITGAEVIKGWEKIDKTLWKVSVPNSMFTDRNPYITKVNGDWFMVTYEAHTGDVFLNGKSMYEVTGMDKVMDPKKSRTSWEPEFSRYKWYTKQEPTTNETVFYAHFYDKNPNKENVEISVRKSCFYPEEEGIGYITLTGFTICQAATQWAPPTAYQEGMVGPHWSKGWIIEDCDIFESKCCGISLGKYLQPENDNKWLKWKYKDGTQTERDSICQAVREGWSKENIGSHIIRRCEIHDCGQAGIIGHLGGIFSIIEDNHIYRINNKQNLAGAEIAGIKMHAAIDVIYRRNHIHHCTRGMWLDWQAQGTRVTQNLFHDNTLPFAHLLWSEGMAGLGEDIFIEVSHGPTLVDHNILLSYRTLKLPTQGVAVVHNLIAGSLTAVGTGVDNNSVNLASPRYTPYHVPHSTEIAGFMTILHGDMRFYNNIFVQQPFPPILLRLEESSKEDPWDDNHIAVGLTPYDSFMNRSEWKSMFDGYCGLGSAPNDRYYLPLPVWAWGNVYFNGAKPWAKEKDSFVDEENRVKLSLKEVDGKWILNTDLYDYLPAGNVKLVNTELLGMAFEPEQSFENPDGTPITFDKDYFDKTGKELIAGPFAERGNEFRVI